MPIIQIPKKLQPIIQPKQRIIVAIGGRGSAKSHSIARLMLFRCQTEHADVLCGREFQNSIKDSVHKLLKILIKKIKLKGFKVTKTDIRYKDLAEFAFKGFARNPETVKSAEEFKYSWIEEAQYLSEDSIKELTPTIRTAGSKLYFSANPQASNDPFSKRFIRPFQNDLDKYGYYADDLHLIIKVNWRDNKWHKELESQRVWDYNNLSRAMYDHIWEGAFYDEVENALIKPEWFDACIDAHKKLGFEPAGLKYASHDPSDIGPDNKGFAFRHGSVVLDVQEKSDGDVNQGAFWASALALAHGADAFTWDCDGLGVTLNGQFSLSFEGKNVELLQFKGSQEVDFPDAVCNVATHKQINKPHTNKEALRNKRAQNYLRLRNRIYRTYEAIEHNKYHDPDKMISFAVDIECLPVLRSELCRMPIKPNANGQFELYRKDEMVSKFKFKSPNLADAVMMLMRPPQIVQQVKFIPPQPLKPMGIRAGAR